MDWVLWGIGGHTQARRLGPASLEQAQGLWASPRAAEGTVRVKGTCPQTPRVTPGRLLTDSNM